MTVEQVFLDYSVAKLNQYYERIEACTGHLTDEQIWARSSENSNAAGNLLLHLAGNVRQWILMGVDGRPDIRDRASEFTARDGASASELLKNLRTALDEVITVIAALPVERLTQRTTVQGHDVTNLEAIYHVVEHFSGHTGQIIFLTKAFTGRDLGFYAYVSRGEDPGQRTP